MICVASLPSFSYMLMCSTSYLSINLGYFSLMGFSVDTVSSYLIAHSDTFLNSQWCHCKSATNSDCITLYDQRFPPFILVFPSGLYRSDSTNARSRETTETSPATSPSSAAGTATAAARAARGQRPRPEHCRPLKFPGETGSEAKAAATRTIEA